MTKSLTQIRLQNNYTQPYLASFMLLPFTHPHTHISVLSIYTLILICCFYKTRYTQHGFSQHALSLTAGRSCWLSALLLSFRR